MTALEEVGHLAGVSLDIEAELGRRTMSMRALLALEPGHVIRVDTPAGDNIDILVGGKAIGSGEIVIIAERFGVRVTDFLEEQ